jgi:hypothetical protein
MIYDAKSGTNFSHELQRENEQGKKKSPGPDLTGASTSVGERDIVQYVSLVPRSR